MKVALITGSSTGIGLETALHLAEHGYRVFATARNPDASEGLRNAAGRLDTVRLDVDDDASVQRAVAETLERAGRIDVLVNNAGIGGGGPIELTPLDKAKQTFETNYFGAIRMIQAVVPGMRERRSGAIVNVTSVAGRVVLAAHSHYAASKFALEAASESLAQELAPYGVRVAVIEPGVVLTPIFDKGGSRQIDPAAPSMFAIRRLWALFAAQLRNPTLPIECARTIRCAIDDPQPKLRYPVGRDAAFFLAGRARLSDEDWIAMSAIEDDEAFYDRAREVFGADLYRVSANDQTGGGNDA
jgi:NAD(P)-dependent dehydrogenase (short-subunit alcohol dehydrogenase family)